MAATLLIVVIIVLLAALTIVNTNTVKRARRETELLDARQQRQWRQRGLATVVPVPEKGQAPATQPVTTEVP